MMRVKTDNAGASDNDQFTLPVKSGFAYDYRIDWGDGTIEDINTDSDQTHTYDSAGTYIIRIRGTFKAIYFNNDGDKDKLLGILQWGDIVWRQFSQAFRGCTNLVEVPLNGAPDLSGLNGYMISMFNGCTSLPYPPNTSNWGMSTVEYPHYMYYNCSSMTTAPDVSGWNSSNFTTLVNFLYNCPCDCDVSMLDISSLTDASGMMEGSDFSQENYDKLLIAWEAQDVQDNVSFHAGSAKYGAGAPATARTDLINDHTWSFTDGGAA
jgi:hypothetical protein